MATTTLTASAFAYVDQTNPNTHYSMDNNTWYNISGYMSSDEKRVLIKFPAFPDSIKRNYITDLAITGAFNYTGTSYGTSVYIRVIDATPDMSTVTWNTISGADTKLFDTTTIRQEDPAADETFDANSAAKRMFVKSLCAYIQSSNVNFRPTLVGGGLTSLTITYDAGTVVTSQVTYKSGPKSGYSNPRNATTFQWTYEPTISYLCADDTFEQASATFYWKSSSDADYTSVAISGSTAAVTIAANTFPTAETISWYVEGTDEDGTTTQTSVYSFSTSAGTASALCTDPDNQVIDGSADYTFKWTITSTDGQEASRTRVSWQLASDDPDGNTWHNLLDVNEARTSYTVAGGTLSAGELRWLVRVWNIDGTEGTRDYATFICVMAPDPVSGLAATSVPFSTISWQSSDQQAYEITIDGVVVQKAYGTDVYNWTVKEPLEDGNHIISVRVQGIYGYWSQPSTVTVTISNTPDTTLTLSGAFDVDAELTWDSSTYDSYIYRDGVRIGKSSTIVYTDRRALGEHTYYVMQIIGDGNYNKSNTVTGIMSVSCKMITLLESISAWLKLKLSENSYDSDGYTWSITNVSQHVLGATYPQLEVSTFEKRAGTYNVAFTTDSEVAAFEALQGKVVILKSKGNNVITGLLGTVSKKVGVFYTTFAFSIQQIDVEDYEEQ